MYKALALLTLLASGQAFAIPVAFQFSGAIDCSYGGGCEEFAADTGLDPYHAPYQAHFRLNTSSQPLMSPPSPPIWEDYGSDEQGQTYLISGPGTGFTIALGDIVLEFDQFYIRLALLKDPRQPNGDPASLIGLWGRSDDHFFFFYVGDPNSTHFEDFTLRELARAPLAAFIPYSLDSAGVAGYVEDLGGDDTPFRDRRWGLTDTSFDSIRRARVVPEPPTLSLLLAAMLALLVVTRRPRRS